MSIGENRKQKGVLLMKIGIPKEIKQDENRVAMTPAGVQILTEAGHDVFIETQAGEGSGFTDQEYVAHGAKLIDSAEEVWAKAELVLKVKEPQPSEYDYFREGLQLFTYLHLAPEPELTQALCDQGVIAIAYETIQLADGSLPLLMPMSEVAGRMSVQVGAQMLEKKHGGKGVLLSGVPGVKPGKVTIIGGGNVGINAAKIAMGYGADVTILDINPARLRELDDLFYGRLHTLISNPAHIAEAVKEADLLIGAVLVPGRRAPLLVTEQMVKEMAPGSVIIDVAVDQGGSIETIDRITTHSQPTYEKYGVVHYAVANIPGAVPRTSTFALTAVTLSYVLEIAQKGLQQAIRENPALMKGVNVYNGQITNEGVADSLGRTYTELTALL